jgi:hypothetical protein
MIFAQSIRTNQQAIANEPSLKESLDRVVQQVTRFFSEFLREQPTREQMIERETLQELNRA